MDLKTCTWSSILLNEFNIPSTMLPKIVSSAVNIGKICSKSCGVCGGIDIMEGVQICGILGDQQAALFGQTCFNFSDIKVTYGTGAFLLMNTGKFM